MVKIEIDGMPMTADPSKMIIQVADEAGIDIPRFCYHKNLSIAANCRMCLVEVEQSRKALPACATPVTEGMKIFTHSKRAIAAQRGVMEFLLINHPLDCPICDQGGECELQDLSIGYGGDVSRFTEGKRVVKDKEIGPLVGTDMTRCIHCTRCVRFGQEIAGVREMGAVGRGEHMEIGTYVEKSLVSELSGNIIDLCPVGALVSKPFHYKARAWELAAHASISPHDCMGSNIEIHTRRNEVMRVVPRENEDVNETWISDRDRFSYLALTHPERLHKPMIKVQGVWQETDWQTALEFAIEGLQSVVREQGAEQIGGLLSSTATVEEGYLFQKLLRGMGSNNVDHRLRQQDFADQVDAPATAPWHVRDFGGSDAVFLIGCNIRSEQPMIAHRIRQGALNGSSVNVINFFAVDCLMPVDKQLVVDTQGMIDLLAEIAVELTTETKVAIPPEWEALLKNVKPTAEAEALAGQLIRAARATLFVGALVDHHPHAATIRALVRFISSLSNNYLVILPTANDNGLTLAGAVPYISEQRGLNANEIVSKFLRGYILLGTEPELDCASPIQAKHALKQADFVINLTCFMSDTMRDYADVVLPIASFAETSGTYVNVDQLWQSFQGAVAPAGESRPAWKVLRVLGNLAEIDGFDYVSSEEVRAAVQADVESTLSVVKEIFVPTTVKMPELADLMWVAEQPSYQADSFTRRSDALQATPENQRASIARMNHAEAKRQGVEKATHIVLTQGKSMLKVAFEIEETIADGCLYLAGGTAETAELGAAYGAVGVQHA